MKYLVLCSALTAFFLTGCSSLSKKTDYSVKKDFAFQSGLIFDIYKPEHISKAPVVLVIHGGGWSARTGDMASICKQLAEQGFLALNLTYRLSPKNVYPKAVDDIHAALDYLKMNAAELGADTDRIYAWGYSAGGHLALLLGLDPASGIKGIVAGGAPTVLSAYPKSPLIRDFIGKTYAQDPKTWEQASPINYVTEKSPPTFLYHGKWDTLVGIDQMRMMKAKLEEKKVPVTSNEVYLWGHIGVYLFSQRSVDQGIEFLQKLAGTK
jgi:acetyl esterase/lipase